MLGMEKTIILLSWKQKLLELLFDIGATEEEVKFTFKFKTFDSEYKTMIKSQTYFRSKQYRRFFKQLRYAHFSFALLALEIRKIIRMTHIDKEVPRETDKWKLLKCSVKTCFAVCCA